MIPTQKAVHYLRLHLNKPLPEILLHNSDSMMYTESTNFFLSPWYMITNFYTDYRYMALSSSHPGLTAQNLGRPKIHTSTSACNSINKKFPEDSGLPMYVPNVIIIHQDMKVPFIQKLSHTPLSPLPQLALPSPLIKSLSSQTILSNPSRPLERE